MADTCELHLVRDWEAAWRTRICPWLSAPARLRRDYVIVPTRGQAHALKLRCVRENIPLLGVEFLTPGLARQKWHALAPAERPALGRDLLVLNLRSLVAERLAGLDPASPGWGVWKSLESDAERALDDFDELLRAGFGAADFELPALREACGELERRVAALGYEMAPRQQLELGLRSMPPDGIRLEGRVLVAGLAVEHWRDFFPLAGLVRRARELLVLVPEPEFQGRSTPDEGWVEVWSALLGVEARPAEPARELPGAAVAQLWSGGGGDGAGADVRVGRTRADEMELVTGEIARRLRHGATNIGVVFPRADAAHQRLGQLLAERRIPFNDLLPSAAPVGIDVRIQAAVLDFHRDGGRIESLLELWPLLRALSFTATTPARAREAAERAFEARQTHAVADLLGCLDALRRPEAAELARVARRLLPAWPAALPLAEALGRFESSCGALGLPLPENWRALRTYAERDARPHPRAAVVATLRAFLPAKVPAQGMAGRGQFAPVTLTTRRGAAGTVWSDLFLVESNAGAWPQRLEPTPWLTDEHRRKLNERGRFSVGLFTGEERAHFEKAGYAALARNTTGRIVFSACLVDGEEPEATLAPNAWLERVLLAQGGDDARRIDVRFARCAGAAPPRAGGAPAETSWLQVWTRRRDPARPFDEYFLGGDPAATRPARVSARLLERAVQDPAELWFHGVLGLRQVDWRPLVRARKRALGSLAHGLLAQALRGNPVEGDFVRRPPEEEARRRLAEAVAEWRRERPADRYWDSFAAELAETAAVLLRKTYAVGAGPFAAVEASLPPGTVVELGPAGPAVEIAGRVDLVWSDQPRWEGAQVDIIDFKTGADARLSAAAMARGVSLQLGVYLAAARVLGAAGGRVWLVKPDDAPSGVVGMAELPQALAALGQVGRHLATGVYGALTPDRTEFSRGLDWPLACTPVRQAVLARKFAVTFGGARPPEEEVPS